MVKVKYKTLSSDPDRTIYPGTVVSVDDAEAKELIENGYAELAESVPEAENEKEEVKPSKSRKKVV
jgi:hypothetical protein